MVKLSTKNFSYFALGRISFTSFLGIFYLIFASLISPEEYGQLVFSIAIAGTTSIISRFGFSHSIIVYQAKGNSLMSNQINVFALITVSVAALILIPINPILSVLSLAMSFFLMNTHNLIGLKKYKKYFFIIVFQGSSSILLSLFLFNLYNIDGILFALTISFMISSFTYVNLFSKKINNFYELKNGFKVLLHNFGVDISLNLVKQIDKIIIVSVFGFFTAGIFSLNLQILAAIETIPLLLHSFLLSEESTGVLHKKISLGIIVISVIISALVILLGPVLILTFFPLFAEGILSLQIIALSITPLTFSAIFYAKLQAKESTLVGYSGLVRIVSLVVLLILLGSLYDLIGLSLAILGSSLINLFILFFIFKQK